MLLFSYEFERLFFFVIFHRVIEFLLLVAGIVFLSDLYVMSNF